MLDLSPITNSDHKLKIYIYFLTELKLKLNFDNQEVFYYYRITAEIVETSMRAQSILFVLSVAVISK